MFLDLTGNITVRLFKRNLTHLFLLRKNVYLVIFGTISNNPYTGNHIPNLNFVNFLHQNIHVSCSHSLELPCRGDFTEYPQDMFWHKNNTQKRKKEKIIKIIILSGGMPYQ